MRFAIQVGALLPSRPLSRRRERLLRSSTRDVSEAFITDQTGDSLSIVELGTLKATDTIAIGGKPAGIAMSADGSRAFVTAPEGKELVVVDAAKRQIVKRIKVGAGPLGVAAHPTNGRVYVADWYKHKIFVVDPVAGTIVSRDPGRPVAVGPRRHARWASAAERRPRQQRGVLHRYADERAARRRRGRQRPFGITIDAAGARAYTANVASDDVSVIDIASRKVIATVPVGRRPYAVALAGGRAFVTNQYGDSVSVIDLPSSKVVKTIDVGDHPEGIEADPAAPTSMSPAGSTTCFSASMRPS